MPSDGPPPSRPGDAPNVVTPPRDVSLGSIIASKYRVDAVLGSGGMGIVFAATHLQLREQVAIKLLHAESAARPQAVERFLREARVAMKMRGEHVVRIFDAGTLDGGAPFIVMEHLSGQDLRAVLEANGALAPQVAVDHVLQACEAIAEAHAIGIVHRDLKPANLFLTTRVDGTPCVKVLDFGVSKIGAVHVAASDDAPPPASGDLAETADADPPELAETLRAADAVTRTRALLGSPRYMAPEQLRSPRGVDARADLWALGVILFELVSGRVPFAGDSIDELRRAVNAPPPPLPGAPPALEHVVHRCLAKEPRDRFAGVGALAEALRPFASDEGKRSVERVARVVRGTARPSAPPSPSPSAAGGRTDDALVRSATTRPSRTVSLISALAVASVATLIVARPLWTPPRPITAARETAPPPASTSAPRAPSPSAPPATASPLAASARAVVAPPLLTRHAHRAVRAAPSDAGAPLDARSALDAAPPIAPAPPATVAVDPLRLDAGALFDRQK